MSQWTTGLRRAHCETGILPVLLGRAGPRRQVTILKSKASVVRAGRWKLITHRGSGGFSARGRRRSEAAGPGGQLYDLDRDLGETTNLWSDRPDVVERLTKILREAREDQDEPARRR